MPRVAEPKPFEPSMMKSLESEVKAALAARRCGLAHQRAHSPTPRPRRIRPAPRPPASVSPSVTRDAQDALAYAMGAQSWNRCVAAAPRALVAASRSGGQRRRGARFSLPVQAPLGPELMRLSWAGEWLAGASSPVGGQMAARATASCGRRPSVPANGTTHSTAGVRSRSGGLGSWRGRR